MFSIKEDKREEEKKAPLLFCPDFFSYIPALKLSRTLAAPSFGLLIDSRLSPNLGFGPPCSSWYSLYIYYTSIYIRIYDIIHIIYLLTPDFPDSFIFLFFQSQ